MHGELRHHGRLNPRFLSRACAAARKVAEFAGRGALSKRIPLAATACGQGGSRLPRRRWSASLCCCGVATRDETYQGRGVAWRCLAQIGCLFSSGRTCLLAQPRKACVVDPWRCHMPFDPRLLEEAHQRLLATREIVRRRCLCLCLHLPSVCVCRESIPRPRSPACACLTVRALPAGRPNRGATVRGLCKGPPQAPLVAGIAASIKPHHGLHRHPHRQPSPSSAGAPPHCTAPHCTALLSSEPPAQRTRSPRPSLTAFACRACCRRAPRACPRRGLIARSAHSLTPATAEASLSTRRPISCNCHSARSSRLPTTRTTPTTTSTTPRHEHAVPFRLLHRCCWPTVRVVD
ncbi:hypothetical protein FB567DRAFT_225122 [Paraphoma chrysanthemicola]|uniref:Uncharacterized protein n=1 Tax=Paraphoma chrysanthemicola TaxID=798071 RepID=A0A8K0QT60_9PLEO|nr:hypothetical protein FB567DRAFT_225122 [Paraphoma chrysanthemicola]